MIDRINREGSPSARFHGVAGRVPLTVVQSSAIACLEALNATVLIETRTRLKQEGDTFSAGPPEDVAVVTLPGQPPRVLPLEALGEEVILAGASLVALGHVLDGLALRE